MRILHVVHQYPPDYIGGVELHTQALARVLAERGHQVSVFYRRSAEGAGLERRQEGDVTVWAAWSGLVKPTGRFLASFRDEPILDAFRHVLEEAAPGLVHIQHLMGLPLALVDLLRQKNVPFVLTLHDYWWLCANAQLLTNDSEELCEGPELWINCGRCALARAGRDNVLWLAPTIAPIFAYRNSRLHRIAELAAHVIVPTTFTRETYQPLNLPSHKLTVIPHGIAVPSVTTFNLEGDASAPAVSGRRSSVVGRPPFRIAYVGGLARQKGVHVLIEAVNHLPREGVSLTLYGDEAAFPEYVAELKALVSHPRIHFAGRIPNEQLLQALTDVDVLVVPSIWYETAALVIQEAFAAGVPVIASNLGALRERVRHGEDGLLVPPGDPAALRKALLELLQDPTLRARLRNGIRPFRTIEQQVDDIEVIYHQVLQEPSSVPAAPPLP
ncbi:MAG TPA: glycosyltransferase family 4 protein [Ardenticatenaceae bacterium]|jgi:glycosyltransferase involved in cell wall biosynthesis